MSPPELEDAITPAHNVFAEGAPLDFLFVAQLPLLLRNSDWTAIEAFFAQKSPLSLDDLVPLYAYCASKCMLDPREARLPDDVVVAQRRLLQGALRYLCFTLRDLYASLVVAQGKASLELLQQRAQRLWHPNPFASFLGVQVLSRLEYGYSTAGIGIYAQGVPARVAEVWVAGVRRFCHSENFDRLRVLPPRALSADELWLTRLLWQAYLAQRNIPRRSSSSEL